mgnify:CR=1 FL=1
MPVRSFQYDHPHYTTVRSHDTGNWDVGSATEFARFGSKFQCVVHTVDIIVTSAVSIASEILTLLHNGSVFTLATFDSSNTVGRVRTITINRTLTTVNDRLGLMHGEAGGEFRVIYTYQVIPLSDVQVA